MPMWSRIALTVAILGIWTSMASADGIDPGLWQITTRVATGVALALQLPSCFEVSTLSGGLMSPTP
jgi:hypothetical protein